MKRLLFILCLMSILNACPGAWLSGPDCLAGSGNVSPEQEARIKDLIKELVGSSPTKWDAAHKGLLEIGLPARSYAEEALKNPPSSGAKSRLEKLLFGLPDPAAREMFLKATKT